MTFIIDRLQAVSINGSPERKTVLIGEQIAEYKPRPRYPLKTLPNRLDAAACLAIIERIDPEMTAEKITASQQPLDVGTVDDVLEHTELGLSDRMRFKSALTEHGLLSRGRYLNR